MDANARTCMRGVEWTDRKVMGAYGRDELNDNGKRLLLHPRARQQIRPPQHELCQPRSLEIVHASKAYPRKGPINA